MNRNTLYRKIRVNLIKGENVVQAILLLKKMFTYLEFQQCIRLMLNSSLYKETMMSVINVRKCSDLIVEGMFPMLLEKGRIYKMEVLTKEFEFLSAYLSSRSNLLEKFNVLRKEFEQALLYGEFESAESILKTIQVEYGISFWYLESRMLLLLMCKKMDIFHQFYDEIKSEADHEIINTYIRILQRKVNFNVLNDEYRSFCEGHLKYLSEKYPNEKEMLSYMEFMSFYSVEDLSQEEDHVLQHLLIISQHLSLVDQYLLFCKMDTNLRIQLKGSGSDKNEVAYMLKAADQFRKDMNLLTWPATREEFQWGSDLSVEYIRNYADIEFETINKQLFLEGKYDKCIEACRDTLKKGIQFKTILLLAQSYITSNTNLDVLSEQTMLDILVKRICKMYVKTTNISQIELWQELSRFFMSCSFGTELLEFVYNRLYASSGFDTVKCMYASLYSQDFISIEHAIVLELNEREKFLNSWVRAVGKCISCFWLENIRAILGEYKIISWDEISCQLFQMKEEEKEDRELRMKQLMGFVSNLDIFFREEYGVFIFNKAVENRDYKMAFKIYVEMFFISELSVLRMDTEKLNKRLHYGNCMPFYGEVDFVVYACNTQMHYINANMPSEFVRNSLRKILKLHGVSKPSLLEIPKGFMEGWKYSYFLYYVCDLKMLNAIDLYDLEAIEERRKILMMVRDRYDCTNELKNLDEEEIRIGMIVDGTESMQMKAVCANWIKISDDNFILSAMQEIKQQGTEYLSVFRNLIIKSKGLYIEAVNEKLGTTIRHCILERIVLGALTNYKVYVDNKTALSKLLEMIPALDRYEKDKQYEVMNCLSNFFDQFFLEIDAVRKNIYFTLQEDEEKVRFYIPNVYIEEGARQVSSVRSQAELRKLVMRTFHKNLEKQIKDMGKSVRIHLQKRYNDRMEILVKELKEIPEMEEYLQILNNAVLHALQEIEQMFEVTYNENEKHLLSSYIRMIGNKFPYILIENTCEPELKIRNGIVWSIDIILKNCIENAAKHAEVPIETANFKVLIGKIGDSTIELTFQNAISVDIDKKNLRATIDNINQDIMQGVYIDKKTEDDAHGMGYYRIAQFLHNNIKEIWKLHLSLNADTFSAVVSFRLGENDEGIDC